MTRHLLQLVWNRKRQNLLLRVEIFFSFLVLFGVVLVAVHFVDNWRQPLGFDIERVWSITVDRKENDDGAGGQGARIARRSASCCSRCARCRRSRSRPPSFTSPYANSSWGGGMRLPGGHRLDHGMNSVTDDFPRALPDAARRRALVLARGRRGDLEAGRDQPAPGAGVLRRRRRVGKIIPESAIPTTAAGPEREAGGQAGRRRDRGLPPGRRARDARRTSCSSACASTTEPEGDLARAPARARRSRHAGRVRGDAGQAR